jgi:hypothetical protein
MIIKQVIQGFRDVIADRTSKVSDDTSYSDRLIYHYLKMCRSRLLYEKFVSSKRPIHKFATQTLECVPLCEIDQNECPCRPAKGCIFLRTESPLPETILITDVRAGLIEFNYVKWEDIEGVMNSRHSFDRKEVFYSLRTKNDGTYLYIHNNHFLESIDVEAMFDEPLDVHRYDTCKKDPCLKAKEVDFPFDSSLMGILYQMAFEKYIVIKNPSQPDILNNDSDEPSGANPQIK